MPPDPHSSALPATDPTRLLEHVGWVRELAQRLVRDPHTAEDLTQETMLAALENGAEARSPRAWLGRVLRNVLWERVRSNRRRESRERAVADETTGASSADIVERVDTQRTVVDAVMRLPEHYRIVLLRRYFEGETPTQIAAALDMPIATVKTRLQRGIEKLRGELDDVYGDRARWQPALVALAGTQRRAAIASLPTAAVTALLLLLGAIAAWAWFDDPGDVPSPPSERSEQRAARERSDDDAAPAPQRTLATATSSDSTSIDWGAVKMPRLPIRGRVVTPAGAPVAGVLLQFAADREPSNQRGVRVVISDGDGRFEMELRRSGRISAVAGDVCTLCSGVVSIGSEREVCVVVAPSRAVHGRIVDPHGNGLEHARLLLAEPEDMRTRLGDLATGAGAAVHTTVSDERGGFAFAHLPFAEGTRLLVEREGYQPREVTWTGEATLTVALQPVAITEHDVRGLVLAADGHPAVDARVSCGTTVTRTDANGSFHLPAPEVPTGVEVAHLVATADGHGAAIAETRRFDELRRPRFEHDITLRLTPAPRTIRGRALRSDGSPAARARVWLADPTLFQHRVGTEQRTSVHSPHRKELQLLWPQTVESVQGHGSVSAVIADEHGAFELTGLCDRSYRLVAYEYATSLRSLPTTASAGATDVELVLRADVIGKVQGTVVDANGAPIAGVSVALRANLVQLRWGERMVFGRQHVRGAMRTGPDGSFWLYDVPTTGVVVDFAGVGIVPLTVEPAATMNVVAPRRTILDVQCVDATAVDTVRALDREGEPVWMTRSRGDSDVRSRSLHLIDGRSERFAVSDAAAVLVGYRDGEEVRRTPIVPQLGTISW